MTYARQHRPFRPDRGRQQQKYLELHCQTNVALALISDRFPPILVGQMVFVGPEPETHPA